MRDALRALQQRRREDALRLQALRMQLGAGIAALERGAFTDAADADLDAYLEGLAPRAPYDPSAAPPLAAGMIRFMKPSNSGTVKAVSP